MQFEYYLTAWLHCVKGNIPVNLIKKTGFKQWTIFAKEQA